MKLKLEIARTSQPEPGHNDFHPMLVSIDGELPKASLLIPRDLSGLATVGFNEPSITKAYEELVRVGTATLEGNQIDERQVRRFFFDAA
jgi:hypothetical protein